MKYHMLESYCTFDLSISIKHAYSNTLCLNQTHSTLDSSIFICFYYLIEAYVKLHNVSLRILCLNQTYSFFFCFFQYFAYSHSELKIRAVTNDLNTSHIVFNQ